MTDLAVSLDDVFKSYGSRPALKGFDLAVEKGSFHALLGPNGSGKSTALRILLGFIRPDRGSGSVLGYTTGTGFPPTDLKARVGYVPERFSLYEEMTGREMLSFAASVNPRWDPRAEKKYVDLFNLHLDVRVRHLSTGLRAQLALTLAMGARPELLILDEPTHGLDAYQRYRFLQALVEDCTDDGRTVLLSSHELHQIERMADHVTLLMDGKAVLSGPLDQVKETETRVRVAGDVATETLAVLPGVRRVSREGGGVLLHIHSDEASIRRHLAGVPGITGVQVIPQSLEEIFLSYVDDRPA